MRVLQVVHGYPPLYNAGSEIYTQTLSHGLAERGHEIWVFTREEDPFANDFVVRETRDVDRPEIVVHLVNVPRSKDRYIHGEVDAHLEEVLAAFRPDVVHIQHLNHVSTSIVRSASRRGLPIVYTLHDFWLMCPRGQFMRYSLVPNGDFWQTCDGQGDAVCARECYARYYSGDAALRERDEAYWTDWVHAR